MSKELADREKGEPNKQVYVSQCCGAEFIELPVAVVKKTSPGTTSYYHNRCCKCGNPTHTRPDKIFDSAGILISPVDLIECPELPENHSERWHAAYNDGPERPIEIRDLGNNNVHMYEAYSYYTRGPYWNHLDKLSDEDLEYYWGVTREQSELLREMTNDAQT